MTDNLSALPEGKYKTIVVDPPWKYGKWGKGSRESCLQKRFNHRDYPLPFKGLDTEEIRALPIRSVMDTDCDVYLWTTQRYLPTSFGILNSWGLKYCQTLTWCKTKGG